MTFDKLLFTKYLKLQILIKPIGYQNHERIICSEKAAQEFNNIINDTMTYMNHRIKSWENEYADKIEEVGK